MMSYAQFLSAVLMLSVIFAFSFQTAVYISLLELLQFIGFVLFSKINTANYLTLLLPCFDPAVVQLIQWVACLCDISVWCWECFVLTSGWQSWGTQTHQLPRHVGTELWWLMAYSPWCPMLGPLSSASSPRTLVKLPHLPSSPVIINTEVSRHHMMQWSHSCSDAESRQTWAFLVVLV